MYWRLSLLRGGNGAFPADALSARVSISYVSRVVVPAWYGSRTTKSPTLHSTSSILYNEACSNISLPCSQFLPYGTVLVLAAGTIREA